MYIYSLKMYTIGAVVKCILGLCYTFYDLYHDLCPLLSSFFSLHLLHKKKEKKNEKKKSSVLFPLMPTNSAIRCILTNSPDSIMFRLHMFIPSQRAAWSRSISLNFLIPNTCTTTRNTV